MEFYKLTAEHVRDKKEVVRKLREKHGDWLAGDDPVFSSMFVVVLAGPREDAEWMQEVLWEHNNGAYCGIEKLTEDEYDALC